MYTINLVVNLLGATLGGGGERDFLNYTEHVCHNNSLNREGEKDAAPLELPPGRQYPPPNLIYQWIVGNA